jgi:acetate kinase
VGRLIPMDSEGQTVKLAVKTLRAWAMPFLMSDDRNRVHGAGQDGRIMRDSSALLSLVIPTNEELVVAR